MEVSRQPFQGVVNIIRFNWHFYGLASAAVLLSAVIGSCLDHSYQVLFYAICIAVSIPTITSLLVSFYVYDLSGLYDMNWIISSGSEKSVINVNAGFDETSLLLKEKYTSAELLVLDFYDHAKHTESSIERARKAYPPYPGTIHTATMHLPVADAWADVIVVMFAAHEIRDEQERVAFFKELKRTLEPTGKIYVTEHFRNLPNLLAYSLGVFHFYPLNTWRSVFANAGLEVRQTKRHTPFVSTFILGKNGSSC